MFPITEKYIDHVDTIEGKIMQVALPTRQEVSSKVNHLFNLKERRN